MSLSKIRVTVPRVYPSNERETSGSNEKDLSVKLLTIIKYKAIRKAAKAASSHNIHLFTLEGEKQHGQAGGVCWMRVTVMTAE